MANTPTETAAVAYEDIVAGNRQATRLSYAKTGDEEEAAEDPCGSPINVKEADTLPPVKKIKSDRRVQRLGGLGDDGDWEEEDTNSALNTSPELSELKLESEGQEDEEEADDTNLASSGGTRIADSPAGEALAKYMAMLAESEEAGKSERHQTQEPAAPVTLEEPEVPDSKVIPWWQKTNFFKDTQATPTTLENVPPEGTVAQVIVEEPSLVAVQVDTPAQEVLVSQESKEVPPDVIQISLNQEKYEKYANPMDKENMEKFMKIFPNAASVSVNIVNVRNAGGIRVPVVKTIGVRPRDGQEVFVPIHIWKTCVINCLPIVDRATDVGLKFVRPDGTSESLLPDTDPKTARDLFSRMEFNDMKLPQNFTLSGDLLKNVVPRTSKS